jgi:hypothetical protein
MEVGVGNLKMEEILRHCEENIKRVSSLQFLMKVVLTPQSEPWTSTEDDKYHSLPDIGHYSPPDADYPYIHISKLGADSFITQK